ncbi:MAG: endo-1,4-beta-xylanase [Spirochaetales bacterium]|nr:endo-1,4-beta-xylanase [Spirochaetales bacterium]
MKLRTPLALVALFALILCSACGPATTRTLANKQKMDFGVAIKAGDIFDPVRSKIIIDNFNLIVPEDSMKWANIRPKKDFWNWSDMDAMVAFAQKNKMKIKGHTFLWHDQNAPYVGSLKTREEAIALLEDHITTIVTRYKGRVSEWDVANEVFLEDGSLRNSIWYRLIGDDFLDVAFHAARKADPKAKLILCDYNTEYAGSAKGDASYEMVKGLKERGVPIDGVAFQLHVMAELPLDEEAIRENIKRFAALGLSVSFSEVDVRVRMPLDESKEAEQNAVYEKLAKIARTEPTAKSMILWGFTDKGSWIPRSFAGFGSAHIFDTKLEKKTGYDAVMKGLSGK